MFAIRWTAVVTVVWWCCCCWWLRASHAISKYPIVCVMAFDGFRPDYLNRGHTPTLQRLSDHGVHAEYLKNVFPTKTFVNFFSMATGMYAHKHAVMGNTAFNANGECIGYSYELFHYNDDITPIWTLNELSGNGRHSGVMMWVGGEYEYRNVTPTFSQRYDKSITWTDRVDRVIEWLTHDETPVNLLHMYFEEPDFSGHKYGTKSKKVNEQLKRVNSIIEYFLKQLSVHALVDKINLIILSDHGMADIDQERVVDLESILDSRSYAICGGSPVLQIQPKQGYEEEIYKNLTAAQEKLNTFQVYRKNEIPERWFYEGTKRMSDLLLVAKLPFAFGHTNKKGDHGYDNAEPLMHAFFTAIGPLFRDKYPVKELQNIDIYALIAWIMRLNTSKLLVKPDATLTNMKHILSVDAAPNSQTNNTLEIFKYFVPKRKIKI